MTLTWLGGLVALLLLQPSGHFVRLSWNLIQVTEEKLDGFEGVGSFLRLHVDKCHGIVVLRVRPNVAELPNSVERAPDGHREAIVQFRFFDLVDELLFCDVHLLANDVLKASTGEYCSGPRRQAYRATGLVVVPSNLMVEFCGRTIGPLSHWPQENILELVECAELRIRGTNDNAAATMAFEYFDFNEPLFLIPKVNALADYRSRSVKQRIHSTVWALPGKGRLRFTNSFHEHLLNRLDMRQETSSSCPHASRAA